MTTRRELLKGAVAVVASAVVAPPLAIISAASESVAPTAADPLLAFMVGTPGEHDGMHVMARSLEDAFKIWGENQYHLAGTDECEQCFDKEHPDRGCTCDPTYYAKRFPKWDNLGHEATPADWLRAGHGYICDRCGNEGGFGDGYVVEGDAVCIDCMTLDDWKTEDPELYAELIDEMLTEEYGEASISA
jgi:hypothetical protein